MLVFSKGKRTELGRSLDLLLAEHHCSSLEEHGLRQNETYFVELHVLQTKVCVGHIDIYNYHGIVRKSVVEKYMSLLQERTCRSQNHMRASDNVKNSVVACLSLSFHAAISG